MTKFVPLTAAHLPSFFDEDGRPLGPASKCPTCNRTIRFDVAHSDGTVTRFKGTCGHFFEVPVPPR